MASFFAILAVLVHFAVFISYSDTGRLGTLFLFISIMAWTAVFIFGSIPMANMKRTAVFFLNLFALLVALLSAVLFMPQADSISVFDKIALEHYPAKADVYRGLLRLGIDYTPFKPPPQKPAPVLLRRENGPDL